MTPSVSVDLILSPELELAVRSEWDALAARGMSSLADHPGASNRPHITVHAGATEDRARALSGAALAVPLPVTLGMPLLFGSGPRRVLARSVVPSAALLALHAAVYEQLSDPASGDTDPERDPWLAPGGWTPHVTLARRLRLDQLDEAAELVGGDLTGAVVGIRVWNPDTATVTTLAGED